MRLLVLLLISLGVCLQSVVASAATLGLVPPAPHGPGPGAATISFIVEVSDGFTTILAIQNGQVLLAADGTATIEVQPFGIINPSVEFQSFDIEYGTLDSIQRTFGTAEIPITLSIDEAHISGPMTPGPLGQAQLGEFGSLALVLGDLDLLISGEINLLGEALLFSVTEADLISGLSNPGFLPNADDDVILVNIDARSAFIDLGNAGGLDVSLQVSNVGADLIQFVPEPSSAPSIPVMSSAGLLVFAAGLLGFIGYYRRR